MIVESVFQIANEYYPQIYINECEYECEYECKCEYKCGE